MNNNCEYRDDKSCYFHPKQVVSGVCHLCLNERLLVLASKQTHLHRAKSASLFRRRSMSDDHKPPATGATFPKIFDLLNRFDFRHGKSDHVDFSDASSSLEDSFISIKFENNNGVGSWENNTNTVSKVCLENLNFSSGNHNLVCNAGNNKGSTKTTVGEHVKPRGSAMKWSRRIGNLLQLSKWKRSNKASVCHVGGKLEGVKLRNSGWITSLTKTRTKE